MSAMRKWVWISVSCVLAAVAWSQFDKNPLKGVTPEVKSLVNFYEIRQFDSLKQVNIRLEEAGLDNLDSASTLWYWMTLAKTNLEIQLRAGILEEATAAMSKHGTIEVVIAHLRLIEAVALLKSQQPPEALSLLKQLEASDAFDATDRVFKSLFYEQMAKVYEAQNDFENAEAFYLKFIDVLGNAERLTNRKAIGYYWLGNFYSRLRNIPKVILSHETSIELAQKAENPEKYILAFNYQNLATAYRNDQNIEAAIRMGRRALHMIKQMYPERHPITAYAYDDFGHIFTFVNNDSALHYAQKAIRIRETYHSSGFEELSRSYRNLGSISLALGREEEAIAYHRKSIDAMMKLDEGHMSIGIGYNAIGHCYSNLLEFDSAVQSHQKALECFTNSTYKADSGFRLPKKSQFDDLFFGIETLEQIAITQNWAYQNSQEDILSERILACTQLALELGDSVWGSYDLKSEKATLSNYIHGLTENGIYHAHNLFRKTKDSNSLKTAFLCAEWRRATLLTEASSQVDQLDSTQISQDLIDKEAKQKNRIEFLQNQMEALRTHPDKYENLDEKELSASLVKALRSHDSLVKVIDEIAPNYLKLRNASGRPTMWEATNSIPDSTTVLNYVFTTTNESDSHNLFVLVMEREKVDFVRIKVDTGFGGVCNGFKKAILDKDYESYVKRGNELYELLLNPLGELKEHLVIIPDGPLHYLSFDALLTQIPNADAPKDYQKLSYLMNDFAISYANSVGYMLSVNKQGDVASDRVLGLAPFAE